jgi:hypothetical protein
MALCLQRLAPQQEGCNKQHDVGQIEAHERSYGWNEQRSAALARLT